ncbi:MAG: PAS domain-containing protein [Rickettsiales bacterium]|jgi:hypothetical protein
MSETNVLERRITLRLISYWEKMRKQNAMPAEADIDPDDLQDLWGYCFLIHVKDLDKPDYNYIYLGQEIQHAYQGELAGCDAGAIASPNAGKLADSYTKVIETCLPLLDEGEFVNLHNDVVKYRQCLLPLGKDGKVDAIFGGMRFKIFPRV